MLRAIALLVNPSAGGGLAGKLLPQVLSVLKDAGMAVRAEATRDIGHARHLAHTAAKAGDVVATLGGDGLAGCAAGALRDVPGAVLGVLPGGRGNDLANHLGIPGDTRAAAEVLIKGVERDLDIGDVGGKAFVGVASLGFDSDATRIANAAPRQLGSAVYAYGAVRALAAWKPADFSIELDGGPARAFRGYSVAVANSGRYGGGMRIAPDAQLDDGLFDVVTIADMPRAKFLALFPRVFKGTHVEVPEVEVHRAREVKITAGRPFVLYGDGDPIGETPVSITAVPHALRVIVPQR